MNYEEMTTEELEALNLELIRQRDAIRAEQRLLKQVLDIRLAKREQALRDEIQADPERLAKWQGI